MRILELTKKTTMVDIVNHMGSAGKFKTFLFNINKFVRFRVKTKKNTFCYHFNPVKYIEDQIEHFCYTFRTISIK